MNMQDKEERAQSRAICEAAKTRNSNLINVSFSESALAFYKHAQTALPAALDYIEQLESRVEALERAIKRTYDLHPPMEIKEAITVLTTWKNCKAHDNHVTCPMTKEREYCETGCWSFDEMYRAIDTVISALTITPPAPQA